MQKMTKIDVENGIIETKLTGLISAHDVLEIMQENASIAVENKCFYWINDFSEATYDISTFEIYDFPKELSKVAGMLGPDKFRIRRAIVSSSIDDNHLFAQLVAANRGQTLGLFDSLDEARNWIIEKKSEIA